VIILGSLDTANERGLALFTDVLDRFVAAMVDLNAAERAARDDACST
jgi:hypothetical protein